MPRRVSWWHFLADAALILLAFVAAHALRFSTGWIPAPLGIIPFGAWMLLAAISTPLWLLIMALHGLYFARLRQAYAAEFGSLVHALAEGLLATILATFAFRNLPDSRLALLITIALAFIWLAVWRGLSRAFARRKPRAAVIGQSELAQYMKRHFAGRATRFELAGAYATPGDFDMDAADAVFCDAAHAAELWRRMPEGPPEISVHLLPEGADTGGAGLSVAVVEGVPTFAFKSAADLRMMRAVKRVVDVAASLVLIVLTSPLWLLAAIGIKLNMPGPVFYAHRRLGVGGREYDNIKFRSMKQGVELTDEQKAEFAREFKLMNDPRITGFGKLLRKSSIDELPQLINILRGELSLVGPRAIVPDEISKYGRWGPLLLTVPPGLTGLWQVSGRSDTTYQQRIDFDLYYINNWSLGLDLLIIARTIPAVLSRKGAV